MSRTTLVLVGVLSLLWPAGAVADIADVLQKLDHGTVADKSFIKTLFIGIGEGFDTANDQLKMNNKPMLSINVELGYRPLPADVEMVKTP